MRGLDDLVRQGKVLYVGSCYIKAALGKALAKTQKALEVVWLKLVWRRSFRWEEELSLERTRL